jgi:hypothetical protein
MRHSKNEVFNGSTRYSASVLPKLRSAVRGEAAASDGAANKGGNAYSNAL